MSLIRHCTRGRSCAYAHSKEEELYHPLMYKTKPCTVFPKCDRHYCPFAHSTEEMRQPFNNPLIHYIWGSSCAVECSDADDAIHRWVLSPLASLTSPLLVTENAQLPSFPGEVLQGQSLHLQQVQQQQQLLQSAQQRWQQDPHPTTQRHNGEPPHNVNSPAASPASLCTFAMQQQRQQRQRQTYLVGASKKTSTPEAVQHALSGYSTKQGVAFTSSVNRLQRSNIPIQRHSNLRQNAEVLQSLKTVGEEAAGKEVSDRTGKGRRPAGAEETLLGQRHSADKVLPPSEAEDLEGAVRHCSRENQKHTLHAPPDNASSTTTTVSTDLQDLLDSESIRRALIMTLAQQLIGPQVNQLSVDQVLIVLDLAVKLAPHLQPTASSSSFFIPSPTGDLLQLRQTESDSPHQSSSIMTNTMTQAPSSAVSQEGRLSGGSSSGSLQRDHKLQQPQQQAANDASADSAPHGKRSATTSVARPTTTDDLLGDTTSSSLYDPQLQDPDPAASLAATQVLIEQLRKLSLINVCEEGSHSCSSPAPSLEEAETSSLSIVRGSSTALWSTSTSPIVGGGCDLSSRYANLSSRHVDLVPTTAMTAAATTFASASSSADEASVCACPSLTIVQELNAGSDKPHQRRISHAATTDESNAGEKPASAASCFPRKARGKLCASPIVEALSERSTRVTNRNGSAGGNTRTAATHGATKMSPRFSSVFGGETLSPLFRGLLPPPGTHGAPGFNIQGAPANLPSASCALPLAGRDSSRCFSDCGTTSVAAASFSPPPPPALQQQQGSFGRSQFFPDVSAQKQQQDMSIQKRVLLTGTLTAARKLSDPFSPQLTTCSHSPSAGHFSSPQFCTGGASTSEPTPAYSVRLPDNGSSNKNSFSQNKGNNQAGSRSATHEGRNAFSDGQYRQRIKADGPQASA